MHAHSLHVLEYSKVVELLKEHTSNALGREYASHLQPVSAPEMVVRRLQETREARLLREEENGIPLGSIYDIRVFNEQARVGQRLMGVELNQIRYTVNAARRLRSTLQSHASRTPLLAEMATNIPILPQLETRLETCINEIGDVTDRASSELARLRSQRKSTHARLTDRVQAIISNEQFRPYIQDAVVTLREGRYCVPVKAEFARAFGGIVHDSSSSGATVFIEPSGTVEMGNELKQLIVKEEQEVDRILRDLTSLVGSCYEPIKEMLALLGHLDLINAKAILASEMQGIEPEINNRGVVKLYHARHPLLEGNVVPIDIELGERFSTLLITGPNTGGKTVALKTVGLLTLMTLAGLQIPAGADSQIALFNEVWADIGDEQDIRQSLSTFSAHMKNIVYILKRVSTNSLVLLDEVGAGTDPAEGAALARAILDSLLQRGSRVIATTHYGELKEYAYARPGVENASVEFNRETLSPTYRILLGVPGSSNALYIAGRLGLTQDLIEAARGFLSNRDLETGELLQQIEKSRRKAAEAERDAMRAKHAAERAQREYETRVMQIADVQRNVKRQAQEEAQEVLRRVSDKAENILKELQRVNKTGVKASRPRQKLNSLRNEAFDALAANPEPVHELSAADKSHVYHKGETVRVTSLGVDGNLLTEPKDGHVAIQVGAMRITLPLAQLRPIQPSEVKAPVSVSSYRPEKSSGASKIALAKAMHISPELMLRALRAEEAQSLLDRYLDDAYTAGLSTARIIHGKGTGALRRVVHEMLSTHPMVMSFHIAREDEGGDGATVVKFREE